MMLKLSEKLSNFREREHDEIEALEVFMVVEAENKKLKEENAKMLKEVEVLREQMAKKDEELQSLKLDINETGNLADFTLKINGVFESAQKAADEFEKTKQASLEKCEEESQRILAEAKVQAQQMVSEAKDEVRRIRKLNMVIIQTLQEESRKIIDKAASRTSVAEVEEPKNAPKVAV